MATQNTLKRSTGKATVSGTTIYTAGSDTTITIIGSSFCNIDETSSHWFQVKVVTSNDPSGIYITPLKLPLPISSGYELSDGKKIVLLEGDELVVESDTDNDIDIFISFLEQVEV